MEPKRMETGQRDPMPCPDASVFIIGINEFYFCVTHSELFLFRYIKKKHTTVYKGLFKSVKYKQK